MRTGDRNKITTYGFAFDFAVDIAILAATCLVVGMLMRCCGFIDFVEICLRF